MIMLMVCFQAQVALTNLLPSGQTKALFVHLIAFHLKVQPSVQQEEMPLAVQAVLVMGYVLFLLIAVLWGGGVVLVMATVVLVVVGILILILTCTATAKRAKMKILPMSLTNNQ